MKKCSIVVSFLLLFFFRMVSPGVAASIGDWGEPAVSATREWTILVYMDGDNNLEYQALDHMKTLERNIASADGKVDVVVLLDRAKGFESTMGDWTETRAYHVTKSVRNDDIDSELLANCGELNMASPTLLEAFVREGLRKYPAPKVALVLWNHGGTWIGLIDDYDAPDTQQGTDSMTLGGLKGVLSRTSELCSGGKFDMLLFEMCLMGQAEVVTACAPFAGYMLAAPTVVSALGMGYVGALDLFAQGNSTEKIVTELLHRGTSGLRYRKDWSISAYDLPRIDAFGDAFGALAVKLAAVIPGDWNDVTRTIFYSQNYGGRDDHRRGRSAFSSIDLKDWLARLKKVLKNPPLKEMEAVGKAAGALILATENGPEIPHGGGLSLYVPLRADNVIPGYTDTDFDKKTGWLNTLSKLYEAQQKDGMEAPRVTSIEFGLPVLKPGVTTPKGGADFDLKPSNEVIPLSGGAMEGSWLKVVIEGKNILWGYMGFAVSDGNDPNGEYTLVTNSILLDDKIDQEGLGRKGEEASNVADVLTPVFRDGRNEMLYKFGGSIHRFSNGEKSVPVTPYFMDVADMTHFVVPGTYSDPSTGGELFVEVKVSTIFYEIESVTAVAPNERGGSTTFDVAPKPEGVFRPILSKRSADDRLREVPGEEIQWKDGLRVIVELIPEGKYVKAVGMAESVGGAGDPCFSKPVSVKANPLLSPHIETTHRHGNDKLVGRYAVVLGIPRRDDGTFILAPSGNVMEVKMSPGPRGDGQMLQVVQKTPGEEDNVTWLNWQPEGLPMLSRFAYDNEEHRFELMERYNVVLVAEGKVWYWKMIDAYDGSPVHLIPLNGDWFPSGGLEGSWAGEDDSALTFAGDRATYAPAESGRKSFSGRYTLTDNVITITPGGRGQAMTLAFSYGDINSLVVSFKDSQSAMIYKRQQMSPGSGSQPQPRPQPRQKTLPPVSTPPAPPSPAPQTTLDGVWGSYFNGQQLVMQIQGAPGYPGSYQYQAWLGGVLFEAGVFSIQGNTMRGQTTAGMAYVNVFQWDPSGMVFSITAPNGLSLIYQRMQ